MSFEKDPAVLGIDPGGRNTGWAIVRRVGSGQWALLESGVYKAKKAFTRGSNLRWLVEMLDDQMSEFGVGRLGIERVFFNKNITSCIDTAEVIGAVSVLGARHGALEFRLTPQQVKAVAGRGDASKAFLARVVEGLCVLESGALKNHEADAAAVAIATSLCPDRAAE